MARPLVSVIIPTFNRAHYVTKAIDSALAQSFADYEIIVVDDGSTDDTKERVLAFGETVAYEYQSNGGVSSARNRGLASSNGKWIAFLDSDDEWRPDYLETQIRFLETNNSTCMQSTDCLLVNHQESSQTYFDLNGTRDALGGRTHFVPEKPFIFVVEHSPWQLGSTIFLKEAISRAGAFDTKLTVSEDFDLMSRVSLLGDFAIVDKVLVDIHRRSGDDGRLSDQFGKDLVAFKLMEATIYDKLMSLPQLGAAERKSLGRVLGAKRRAIGNALRAEGRSAEARGQYQSAFWADRSLRSLGRYLLLALLG